MCIFIENTGITLTFGVVIFKNLTRKNGNQKRQPECRDVMQCRNQSQCSVRANLRKSFLLHLFIFNSKYYYY